MTKLTIIVQDIPTECEGHTGIRLALISKKDLIWSSDGVFTVTLERAPNRKGEEHWVGESVVFHGDGRRFIYLGWLDDRGTMFGRIKLFLEQIPSLAPGAETARVKISGTGKRGRLAYATAIILE